MRVKGCPEGDRMQETSLPPAGEETPASPNLETAGKIEAYLGSLWLLVGLGGGWPGSRSSSS